MIAETIDTTHVTKDEQGRWLPAPRKSHAIVTVRSPLWGDEDKVDQIVGFEVIGPIPIFVNAGQSLHDAVGISAAHGEEIFTAIACTREDYLEFLTQALKKSNAAVDCPEF